MHQDIARFAVDEERTGDAGEELLGGLQHGGVGLVPIGTRLQQLGEVQQRFVLAVQHLHFLHRALHGLVHLKHGQLGFATRGHLGFEVFVGSQLVFERSFGKV